MKRWLSNHHPSAPSSYESQAIPCCYARIEPTTATTACHIDSQLHVDSWPPHTHCIPHQLPSPSVMSTLLCWLGPSLPHQLGPPLPCQLTFSTMLQYFTLPPQYHWSPLDSGGFLYDSELAPDSSGLYHTPPYSTVLQWTLADNILLYIWLMYFRT